MNIVTYILNHDDLDEPVVLVFDESMDQLKINAHIDFVRDEMGLDLEETHVFSTSVIKE